MKPIIELSGLLSFRLFKTYLPLAHHSSWNVLEEINAARTQMPTLTRRHDAFEWSWEHKRLFIKLQVCFSWIWRKKGKKNAAMASRCNYKDIQQKDTQFHFSNLPIWNMHDNVSLNKDIQCSKRLWHFTLAQTIGYFSMFLNFMCNPHLFLFSLEFFLENWLDYLPST